MRAVLKVSKVPESRIKAGILFQVAGAYQRLQKSVSGSQKTYEVLRWVQCSRPSGARAQFIQRLVLMQRTREVQVNVPV